MKLRVDYCSKWLLVVLILALGSFAYAQRTITGKVTDAATGEPLIGANILVIGTSVGTATDIDGAYSLEVPEGATEIEVTYTGYAAQRVALGASNTIDVSLSAGQELEEVVVVGYGTQRAREVTSAVTSVKAEDFNRGNVNDPTQLIQGKIAGLQVAKVGGDPNANTTIRLRGLSTLGANTSPLIIIDGVIGATLESVDPNDIASIDVLKDGSAAAIYGTRASSGVIIITTKKGSRGAAQFEYNGYVSAESIANQVETASPAEFAALRPNFDRGEQTDWVDEVSRTGISHVHNLALSGGLGTTANYRASINYRNIEGIGIYSGFDQLNGRLNLTQRAFDDRLTINANLATTRRDANYSFNEAFRYATLYNPTAPVRFTEGSTSPLATKYGGYYQEENFDFFNPVAILEQGTNIGRINDLLLSGRVDYRILDGLTAGVFYSQLRETEQYREYYDKQAYFRGFGQNGRARGTDVDRNTQLFEVTGNFDRQFGALGFQALAGYSYQEIQEGNIFFENGGFISNDITFNRLQFGQRIGQGIGTLNSFREGYKVIGFFGRVSFNLDNTYFLQASVRQEGNTRFGEGNKWGTFPGISAGVTLSNLLNVSGIDNLKIRAGYGETGNPPPGNFLSLFTYEQSGSFFYNGNFVPAYRPARNANPDLKWEIKGEFNAGIDFALLGSKLTGSIDYYNRITRDLIYNVRVPQPPNQAAFTQANLEDVELRNNGLELSVGYAISNSKFSWEPRLILSTFNTILDTVENAGDVAYKFFQSGGFTLDNATSPGAPGLNDDPSIIVQAGQSLGQLYGLIFTGIDDKGNAIYADANGDGTVDQTTDKVILGSGLPDFSLGFQSAFRYGNLDFNFFLRGDFGHDLANMYRVFYENTGVSRQIENIVQTEYFDPALKVARFSSRFVENASYLALDNATLGYTFKLGQGAKISNFRVYLTGQNLFYITDYTGVDPTPRFADQGETDNGGFQNTGAGNPLFVGLDRRNIYFRTRTFTLGINLGF